MDKEREKAKRLEELNYKINMRRLKDSKMWDDGMPGSLTLKGRVDTAKWAHEQIMSLTPLKDLVKSYIQKHHISCPDSIYQMDKPQVDAIDLVCELCEIVGFIEEDEE